MKINIIPKSASIRKINSNTSYGVSSMPDINGPPVSINVIKISDIDINYNPDIIIERPIQFTNAVSPYPKEFISKYSEKGIHDSLTCFVCNPLHCKQCKLTVRFDMLNENGYCVYCREGINKRYPCIT